MAAQKQQRLRRVAVLIESSRAFRRDLLMGVARYHAEHGNWSIYFEPRGLESALPRWLGDWQGDGILICLTDSRQVAALQATGLSVIDLRGMLSDVPFPTMRTDNRQAAQLAFAHLRERGLSHFAYCGPPLRQPYYYHHSRRSEEFHHVAVEAGFSCSVYYFQKKEEEWEQEQEQLAAWLREQPKPLGIFACYDERGYQVLDACRRIGLAVPEEAAILGSGNDTVLCNLTIPPMSSIRFDMERAGYLAASWLDRLMDGESAPSQPIWFPPQEVVARRSTNLYAFDDAALNRVLAFIGEHACEGIRVSDLLSVAQLSMNELERRFQRHLGRTPKAELLRVQMEQAKRLLCDTNLSLKNIARRAGFSNENYFSNAFHRECGVRPTAYRRRLSVVGSSE
ncbi:MAG TPA: DNA-binding transcriptional regulator [Gemmataceae bacterium]|jgi:LacI family transcriptional regulator